MNFLNTCSVFEILIDDLITQNDSKPRRNPGPASRLDQLTEKLGKLPKNKQQIVVQMLDGSLQQETTQTSSS